MRVCHWVLSGLFWSVAFGAWAEDDPMPGALRIYIDADYTIARQTALSIEHGLASAFAMRGFSVAGEGLEIVPLDHRANQRRSIMNIRQFHADEQGLVVIGGLHSPPYMRHLSEINESGVPMLLAWSASGTLTRYSDGPLNWVFRVSVDDRMAGPFIADQMIRQGCQTIGLAVIDNGWGHGNSASITAALAEHGLEVATVATLSTEIGPATANEIAVQLAAVDVECLGLVGNDQNSALLLNAIHGAGLDLQVFSHWGFFGGDFEELTTHDVREWVSLRVLQSCGLDRGRRNDHMINLALGSARDLGYPYQVLSDAPAPAGFVHGFDIGLILMAAIEQAQSDPAWDGPAVERRLALRNALEALETPVQGILKNYDRPFAPNTPDAPNGHEALSHADLCLAAMDENGRMVPIERSNTTIEEARNTP